MRAVVVGEPGGPEVLELREVPRPTPGVGQVRIRVHGSGVNRADVFQRRGLYPAPPGWPEEIPGLEVAGVVESRGPGCRQVEVGDAVMALLGGGGYAEYVVVHERELLPIPDGLDTVRAGGFPEVFLTAFDALVLQMGLSGGETVLIHAVGSGVGTAALQIAREWGARTVGTSRTPWKLDRATGELGLDVAVEGGDREWAREVKEATGGRGADVVLDLVGAAYLKGNQAVLAPAGRWIVVGVPGGTRGTLDLRALMSRRASITGTVLRARPLEEKIALARDAARRLLPLVEAGRVAPVVDDVVPVREVASAHERMESNSTFGSLVLAWD